MIVKHLIKQLQKLDGELIVHIPDHNDTYSEATTVGICSIPNGSSIKDVILIDFE